MKQDGSKKKLTIRTLNKSNVWDLQENDVLRMWENAEKDPEVKENPRHYIDIIRTAFLIEEIDDSHASSKTTYEQQGYRVSQVKVEEGKKITWAIKKRPIMRVTDLSYENIHHISASKLIEVLSRNFGGGWESLSQSVQDIIENGFDISTTTLPADRLHKPGGMYERKIADGYEVLEIPKGAWVEAIFAKEKPQIEKLHLSFQDELMDEQESGNISADDKETEMMPATEEALEEEINEENYRTTFDIDDGPEEQAEEMNDFDEER